MVGGGPSSFNSQVSLENNVRDFLNLVPADAKSTVIFGGGADQSICDVTEYDQTIGHYPSVIYNMLGLDRQDYMCRYRHNKIKNVIGPIEKKSLLSAISEIANRKKNQSDEGSFRFYFTGHGHDDSTHSVSELSETEENARIRFDSNFLATWKGPNVHVQEFTQSLDEFLESTPIQIVMTQCYSGGFAQINYVGGELDLDHLSPANRCGFFAQVYWDMSVGCSNYAFENVYYSNYFFKAYQLAKSGVMAADYNHDGVIGGNEAHAFAIMHSDTTDIPVKTSDQLLNDYRQQLHEDPVEKAAMTSWQTIAMLLDPTEKQIVADLSSKLHFSFDQIQTSPRQYLISKLDELDKKYDEAEKEKDQAKEEYKDQAQELLDPLISRHPTALLNSNFVTDRSVSESTHSEADQLLSEIQNSESFDSVQKNYQHYGRKYSVMEEIKKTRAKYNRLLNIINEKLMLTSLPSEIRNKYIQLRACESAPYFQ